ncbi:MAG: CDP-alcohol phosphatidyltransferase family protein [Spirochaetota bacterium]|nr:CDP-alcohol phosphatidyltransferase family protein [Spirochaetota bacterium]
MANKIKKTIIILNNYNNKESELTGDELIAGEPLLRRSVLACQLYGIETFYLIYQKNEKDKWSNQLIEKRITSKIEWIESSDDLTKDMENIYNNVCDKDEHMLIFGIDTLIHPSILDNIKNLDQDNSYICVWANSYEKNGSHFTQTKPLPTDKYISNNILELNKIIISNIEANKPLTGDVDYKILDLGYNKKDCNLISLDILVASIKKIYQHRDYDSLSSLIENIIKKGQLKIFGINRGVWCKLKNRKSLSIAQKLLFTTVTKKTSGPISRHINSRISKPITKVLLKLKFTPNISTILTVITAFIASYFFLFDGYLNLVLAGFFWQMAAVVDRCDGELARIRHYVTDFGGWLDTITDNLEYTVLFICFVTSMYLSKESLIQDRSLYIIIGSIVFLLLATSSAFLFIFMKKTGMNSQQTFVHDFQEIADREGGIAKVLNFLKPASKRDMWSFILFLLCLANLKEEIFWIFMFICFMISFGMFIGLRGNANQEKE